MRAMIYCRVSTEEQGNNYSLPSQQAACEGYAAERAWDVAGVVLDTTSGATLDRPGLAQIRSIVTARGCHALIVYALDRLSRNVAHLLLLRDELARYDVQLHMVSRGESVATPEGRLFDTLEASFGEFERLKLKERVSRGRREKVQNGAVLGAGPYAPYGYRFVGERREKQMVIDEAEATTVRQIYQWYLEGVAIGEIIDRLHAMGIPKPGHTTGRAEVHLPSKF